MFENIILGNEQSIDLEIPSWVKGILEQWLPSCNTESKGLVQITTAMLAGLVLNAFFGLNIFTFLIALALGLFGGKYVTEIPILGGIVCLIANAIAGLIGL